MKLRCLIVDDEPLAHDVILAYAKEIDFLEIVGQCHLATEALTKLRQQEVDLIFLDINMPKLKGLDFLRTLNKIPLVIITSAYEEYALESFELSVCDYLLKPFRFDRFLQATNKALELFELKNKSSHQPIARISEPVQTAGPTDNNDFIFIKSDKKHLRLDLTSILYFESYGNYVKVWTGDQFHLTPGTLSGFKKQIPTTLFLQIHKSFIINKQQINYLEGNMLMMQNEKILPVGKSYRSEVMALFGK